MFKHEIKLYIQSLPLVLLIGSMIGFEYGFNNLSDIQNNKHKLKLNLIELKYDLLYDVKLDGDKYKLELISKIDKYLNNDDKLHKNIMISNAISNSITGFFISGLYPITFPYFIIYRYFF